MKYLRFSLGINLLTIVTIIGVQNFLPPIVPLFYGRVLGKEQLVESIGLLIAPVSSLTIVILNYFLIRILRDDFLRKLLDSASLLVSVLTFITVFRIILLIGSF